MDEIKKFKVAGAIGCVTLIVALIWKANLNTDQKQKAGEDMRIVNISLELTDAEYLAMKRAAARNAGKAGTSWTAEEEILLIAQAAVSLQVAEEIKREQAAVQAVEITNDFIVDDAPVNPEPERRHAEINDPTMPRSRSVFGMEVADAEYLYLQEQSRQDHLTASRGVFHGPSGREKWYNLDMDGVIRIMREQGYSEEEYPYHVREDGVKMFGRYVMVAANTYMRPKGTILDTSLGEAMVVDHCTASESEFDLIDIAVSW